MTSIRGPGLSRPQWPTLLIAVAVAALLGWSIASPAPESAHEPRVAGVAPVAAPHDVSTVARRGPASANEPDIDTAFEEDSGSDGLSDAPFTGPSNNSAIGLGGGSERTRCEIHP